MNNKITILERDILCLVSEVYAKGVNSVLEVGLLEFIEIFKLAINSGWNEALYSRLLQLSPVFDCLEMNGVIGAYEIYGIISNFTSLIPIGGAHSYCEDSEAFVRESMNDLTKLIE